MATIVPATIAAVVSLLVAFLGHWQWRRQQAAAAADRYHAERADALKELWNKLNDHSTAARIARLDSEQFYRNIQDLNFFLIRRSPFLTESEKDLAHLYLESIYAFRIKVDKSRDKLLPKLWRQLRDPAESAKSWAQSRPARWCRSWRTGWRRTSRTHWRARFAMSMSMSFGFGRSS